MSLVPTLTVLARLVGVVSPASGGSGPASAASVTSPVISPISSASPASSTSLGVLAGQGCHLCGLVLGGERWEGFVERCGGNVDLLGRLKHFVSGLEDVFICLPGKGFVTDVGSNTDGQLHGPDGQGGSSATTTFQFLWLLTNVVDDLCTQLGRKSCHLP